MSDVFGDVTGISADELGVIVGAEDLRALGSPRKNRVIKLAFGSLRWDSRGGVGGLAMSSGNGVLVGGGSTMAASSRAVCEACNLHRESFRALAHSISINICFRFGVATQEGFVARYSR